MQRVDYNLIRIRGQSLISSLSSHLEKCSQIHQQDQATEEAGHGGRAVQRELVLLLAHLPALVLHLHLEDVQTLQVVPGTPLCGPQLPIPREGGDLLPLVDLRGDPHHPPLAEDQDPDVGGGLQQVQWFSVSSRVAGSREEILLARQFWELKQTENI